MWPPIFEVLHLPKYFGNLSIFTSHTIENFQKYWLLTMATLTPTTSLYYSESSFHSEMLPEYFSLVTKEAIWIKCHNHCVICTKVLVGLGQCIHILDAAEEGMKMVGHFSQHRSHIKSHPYIGDKCWGSWSGLQPISCCKWHFIWVARCSGVHVLSVKDTLLVLR